MLLLFFNFFKILFIYLFFFFRGRGWGWGGVVEGGYKLTCLIKYEISHFI